MKESFRSTFFIVCLLYFCSTTKQSKLPFEGLKSSPHEKELKLTINIFDDYIECNDAVTKTFECSLDQLLPSLEGKSTPENMTSPIIYNIQLTIHNISKSRFSVIKINDTSDSLSGDYNTAQHQIGKDGVLKEEVLVYIDSNSNNEWYFVLIKSDCEYQNSEEKKDCMFTKLSKERFKVTIINSKEKVDNKKESINNENGSSSLSTYSGKTTSTLFVQKGSKVLKQAAKPCKNTCKHGVCYHGECKCKSNWVGVRCDRKMRDDLIIPLYLLILLFIAAVLLGIFLTWLIYALIKSCFDDEKRKRQGQIALYEKWEVENEGGSASFH